jgi:hypothetical protein
MASRRVRLVWGNVELPWAVDKDPSCFAGYPSDYPFLLHFFFAPAQGRIRALPEAVLMRRTRRCPKCHSTNLRPSHEKNFLERAILPYLHLRPYRCEDCDKRFFGVYRTNAGDNSKTFARVDGMRTTKSQEK